jgi:L-lactate utilization protein LutC
MLEKVCRALGRTQTAPPPAPPALPEPLIRLVHSDIGLPELFARMAREAKFKVTAISADDLLAAMIAFLQSHNCELIGLPKSALLEKLGLQDGLRAAGFDVRQWGDSGDKSAEKTSEVVVERFRGAVTNELRQTTSDGSHAPAAERLRGSTLERGLTLDEAYDLDCGITDVCAAIAETGSIVIRPDAGHGRLLSLAPPIHIAVIEPRNFLADLVDLFEKLGRDGIAPNTTIITGPSKTADIEGVLVTGVHGPGVVQLFILS